MNTGIRKSLSIVVINQTWFVEELRAMGHSVVTAGWLPHSEIVVPYTSFTLDKLFTALPAGFTPDVLLYLDDSSPNVILDLDECPIPMAYYSIDAHHHSEWQKFFGAIFDTVFVAQQDYLREFLEYNASSSWLPLWVPMHLEPAVERDIDVAFRGTLDAKLHPQRAAFFDSLREHINIDIKSGRYDTVYTRAKIVINEAVLGDVNFRVFEALASGALLLTPRVGNGLLDLFTDKQDLVCFEDRNVSEVVALVKHYLAHEDERCRIAANGFEKVRRLHTSEARARHIADALSQIEHSSRPKEQLGAAVSHLRSGVVLKKVSLEASLKFLRRCADLLVVAMENKQFKIEEVQGIIERCKYELELIGHPEDALKLSEHVRRYFPTDIVNNMSHIAILLSAGRTNEAVDVAHTFSRDPHKLFEQVPGFLSQLRESLFN